MAPLKASISTHHNSFIEVPRIFKISIRMSPISPWDKLIPDRPPERILQCTLHTVVKIPCCQLVTRPKQRLCFGECAEEERLQNVFHHPIWHYDGFYKFALIVLGIYCGSKMPATVQDSIERQIFTKVRHPAAQLSIDGIVCANHLGHQEITPYDFLSILLRQDLSNQLWKK